MIDLIKRRQFLTLSALSIFPFNVLAKNKLTRTGLVLDSGFEDHHINPQHPESPARYQAVITQLQNHDLIHSSLMIAAKPDSEKYLTLIHSEQHIATIKQNDLTAHQSALLATSAALAAVDAVCSAKVDNAFCASRPPGHHALNTGQEEGFCYYNHIAIAARYAQKYYGLKKILIIDWDYHHGNGTEWAFYDDPSVLYFSTHDQFAYPGTGSPDRKGEGQGEGFNINMHLDCGASDKDIATAFQQYLDPAVKEFKPDLILISAGFDSREDDLLGCHKISDQGFVDLTHHVKEMADTYCNGRIVSLLEGGYNIQGNASAVTAHITALMNNAE